MKKNTNYKCASVFSSLTWRWYYLLQTVVRFRDNHVNRLVMCLAQSKYAIHLNYYYLIHNVPKVFRPPIKPNHHIEKLHEKIYSVFQFSFTFWLGLEESQRSDGFFSSQAGGKGGGPVHQGDGRGNHRQKGALGRLARLKAKAEVLGIGGSRICGVSASLGRSLVPGPFI